jgi:hypothetical protein
MVVPQVPLTGKHRHQEIYLTLAHVDGLDDRFNPHNMPTRKKGSLPSLLRAVAFVVTFSTTVFSTATAATFVQSKLFII